MEEILRKIKKWRPTRITVLGTLLLCMAAALVGLIPNCASSVLLAQLYLQGAISFGSLFAGLCAGAGIGLAVLWRVNPSWKQNLFLTGALWAGGSVCGVLLQALPL